MSELGKIGKYQLLKKLATGGMAEVFLARQTGMKGFEKVVVIKRILPHLAMQERFVQMFLDEARLAARFNHPNIVQIYDLGEENGSYYIAMEYINGEDLRSVVKACAARGERIPMEHVVKIISAVLDGLHYAHQQTDLEGHRKGIVHRDVSPHNIIVSFEGGVKLVDFGIARARSEISTTIPGRVKGKHAYMSPEQCQGLELDCRSDIFSAGIVLYELLTWTRLFKRKSNLETLKAVVRCQVRPPRQLRPEIPPELEAIVMKALARNPDDRFQSARDMQLALEDFLLAKGLKSNSALLSQYLSELFSEKLEARHQVLDRVKASSLEGVVLASKAEEPDLIEFLDMFFKPGDSGTASSSSSNGELGGSAGPEFTPSGNTPAVVAVSPPASLPEQAGRKKTTGRATRKSERPSEQAGTSERFPAEAAGPDLFEPAPAVGAEAALEEPPPPLDPVDEMLLQRKSGGGFRWMVALVVLVLGGGLFLVFHGKKPGSSSSAPALGRVKVSSIPSEADVYFDGSRLPSLTPTEIGNVEPGKEHTLEVRLPGLPTWKKTFVLTDTTKPLEFEAVLDRKAAEKAKLAGGPIVAGLEGQGLGTVQVSSEPPGALVYLDGVDSGRKTPAVLRRVPAGLDHVVMLEKKGFAPAFERFSLENGKTVKLSLTLEKSDEIPSGRHLVRIESEPEGAKVVVNGFPLSRPTPVRVKLLLGAASEVEVSKEGWRSWKRRVRPVPGVDLTIFARLEKK